VSQRLDFLTIDTLYMLDESLEWDGKVPSIDTNGNKPALSTLKLNVDVVFMYKLKGAYSACSYFFDENELRQKK